MARQSSFRKSGGFLNQVDGTIIDYRFTDEFNNEPYDAKARKRAGKSEFHSLYFVPSVQVDGADEPITTTLFAGGWDDWDVSEDGHTLTPTEDGRQLGAGTGASIFIQSIEENGHPIENDAFPEGVYNYEPMIGLRCRFVQRRNEALTALKGKRIDKKTGKPTYDRQDLVVETVYEGSSAPVSTSAAKGAPKAAKAVKAAGKPNGKVAGVPAVAEDAVGELAKGVLMTILGKTSPIPKVRLSTAILRELPRHELRDDVRKWVFKDENLEEMASEGLIAFDKAKQTLSAAE